MKDEKEKVCECRSNTKGLVTMEVRSPKVRTLNELQIEPRIAHIRPTLQTDDDTHYISCLAFSGSKKA